MGGFFINPFLSRLEAGKEVKMTSKFFPFILFLVFRPVFFLNEIEKEYRPPVGRLAIFNWYMCFAVGTIPAIFAAPLAASLSHKFGIQSVVQISCIAVLAIGWIAIYTLSCLRSRYQKAVDKLGVLLVGGASLIGCLVSFLIFTTILISDPAFAKM